MTPVILESRLEPVHQRQLQFGLWFRLALTWVIAAVAAVALAFGAHAAGISPTLTIVAVALAAALAALVVVGRHVSRPRNPRALAELVEGRHPDLRGLLLTAVQQTFPKNARPH